MTARRSLTFLAASSFICVAAVSAETPPAATPTPAIRYKTPMPPYPHQAMGARIEGTGSVKVTFDTRGDARHVEMVQTTGSTILDRNTVLFVQRNWKSSGGVSTTKTIIVEYRMPTPPSAQGRQASAQMLPTGKGFYTPPPYPHAVWTALKPGILRLQITSDQSGKIVRTKVVRSSGDDALDGSTSDWVRLYWRFPPGKLITHETEFDYVPHPGL